ATRTPAAARYAATSPTPPRPSASSAGRPRCLSTRACGARWSGSWRGA
ncbi:MAG: UDP-glucose 4-epimerase, partial [uncultured Rubrobacteraceae bacterium]